MRITKIEIKNFRAFYGSYQIDLHKAGKNLLIYGENGSGKSSLYLALNLFLESAVNSHQFEEHQNIFVKGDSGYIRLHLRANPSSKQLIYKWSKTTLETNDPLIIDASKVKGFLDYKTLLAMHYVRHEEREVNIFDLLIENLLANTINDVTGQTFADDWTDIKQAIPRRNTKNQVEAIKEKIVDFNSGLSSKLDELKEKVSEILGRFGYNISLDFGFQGIEYNRDNKTIYNNQIFLTINLFNKHIPSHHHFLNESKLSAIAIAISFSSILLQPESELKIIALDDVLIGLDMSNRLPVLGILREYFSNHQIFFMTYDRAWYEIVRQQTPDDKWKYAEFYFSQTDEYEIPIYVEGRAYLEKAREYFDANDYKACVIYLRTAFEVAIKKLCHNKGLQVKYRENMKHLTSEDFWRPIKDANFIETELIEKVELYRKIILNPLSHNTTINPVKKEIAEAIEVVENLEKYLSGNRVDPPDRQR